jgi:hypothetical protein
VAARRRHEPRREALPSGQEARRTGRRAAFRRGRGTRAVTVRGPQSPCKQNPSPAPRPASPSSRPIDRRIRARINSRACGLRLDSTACCTGRVHHAYRSVPSFASAPCKPAVDRHTHLGSSVSLGEDGAEQGLPTGASKSNLRLMVRFTPLMAGD